jgi:hypothetical protein
MAEKTKVNLTSKSLKETREFDVPHAEKLLKYQGTVGGSDWELADKNFELKDGAITPTGKGSNKSSGQQGGDNSSTAS